MAGVHEGGLTGPQVVALLGAVNVLQPNFSEHSRRVSVILYEKYPQYLRLFRQTPSDNNTLHAHSEQVMRFLFDLIEQGLTKRDLFKPMLGEFVRQHRRHGLTHQDMVNMTTVYKEYLRDVLEPHVSETLELALEVFFDAVAAVFVDET